MSVIEDALLRAARKREQVLEIERNDNRLIVLSLKSEIDLIVREMAKELLAIPPLSLAIAQQVRKHGGHMEVERLLAALEIDKRQLGQRMRMAKPFVQRDREYVHYGSIVVRANALEDAGTRALARVRPLGVST